MVKHLVIPDPHQANSDDFSRFKILGELISDVKPDHVICLGDFADLDSLFNGNRLVKTVDNEAYRTDLAGVHLAQHFLFETIKRRKKKLPKFWMLIGNHEQRMVKLGLDLDDLHYEGFGWEVIEYEGATPGYLHLDGITYTHFLPSSNYNINRATELVTRGLTSITVGHSHALEHATSVTAKHNRIHGLVAGCYREDEPDWMGLGSKQWWRGVVLKDYVEDGDYDPTFIRMSSLREMYD